MIAALLLVQAISLPENVSLLTGECSYPGGAMEAGEVRLACDSAVVSPARDDGILVQFTDRGDEKAGVTGFAGRIDEKGDVAVQRLYLSPGKATPAIGGHCRIFMTGNTVTGISCVGRTAKAVYVANFTVASR